MASALFLFMTVAASIEVLAGGQSEPGHGLPGVRAAGKAHGAMWGRALGASASVSTVSTVPAAASFRSSWQLVLASLNAGVESSDKENAVDENLTAAVGFSEKTAGIDAVNVAHTSINSSKRSRQVSAIQIAPANGEKNLSLAVTVAGHSVSRTALAALRQSSNNPVSISGATVRPQSGEEVAGNLQSHGSVKSTKLETVSGEAVATTAANIAMAPSIPVAIQDPAAEVQPASTMEEPNQATLTDLSSQLPINLNPGSIPIYSSIADGSGLASGGTITSRNQSAGMFDGVEAVDSRHLDDSGGAAKEASAAANQSTETVIEGERKSLPQTHVSVAPAAVTVPSVNRAEEITAAVPVVREKVSTVHTRISQSVVHSSVQGGKIEEVKSSAGDGLEAPVVGVEPLSPGRMQPQAENTLHADSQPRLHAQSVIQGGEANAAPVGSGAMQQRPATSDVAASPSAPAPDTAPIAGKACPDISLKASSGLMTPRASRAAATVHGDRQSQAVQAVQDGANSAVPGHDLSAVRMAVKLDADSAGAANKEESTAQDTFAALDAENSSGTATWLHTGTQHAEAGFQDPELGWVGVRADANGGGVHASLVPGSTEAAATLGGHLAGLNAYLAEQHTPVDSLTLAATEERSANAGMGQGAHESMQQDMNQGAGQDTGQGTASDQQFSPMASSPVRTTAAGREIAPASSKTESTAQAFASGGTHISVMA